MFFLDVIASGLLNMNLNLTSDLVKLLSDGVLKRAIQTEVYTIKNSASTQLLLNTLYCTLTDRQF